MFITYSYKHILEEILYKASNNYPFLLYLLFDTVCTVAVVHSVPVTTVSLSTASYLTDGESECSSCVHEIS